VSGLARSVVVAKKSAEEGDRDMADLARSAVENAGKLLSQQLDLLRAEVRQELARTGGAAGALAAGGGLVGRSGLLSGFTLVHFLHRCTRLPLWLCYGAVAGACGTAGATLLQRGRKRYEDVQLLPPPQTAAALAENVAWLKQQADVIAP